MLLDVEERLMTQRNGSETPVPDVADARRDEDMRVLTHEFVDRPVEGSTRKPSSRPAPRPNRSASARLAASWVGPSQGTDVACALHSSSLPKAPTTRYPISGCSMKSRLSSSASSFVPTTTMSRVHSPRPRQARSHDRYAPRRAASTTTTHNPPTKAVSGCRATLSVSPTTSAAAAHTTPDRARDPRSRGRGPGTPATDTGAHVR